jgi:hypothetical protein
MSSLRKLTIHDVKQLCLHQLPAFVALRDLDLTGCYLTAAGWTSLCHCTGLTHLCICIYAPNGPGAHELSKLVSLQYLDMSHSPATDDAISAVSRHPHLTHLNLTDCRWLSDVSPLALLPQLRHLLLGYCLGLPAGWWDQIAPLRSLQSLNVVCCPLEPRYPLDRMTSLTSLTVSGSISGMLVGLRPGTDLTLVE